MNLHTLFLMRHEILLVLLILYELIADITDEGKKRVTLYSTLALFTLITVAGFIPTENASLFGGMYVVDGVREMMKNILNFATLIVLLQSSSWIIKDENQNKLGTFYLLLFSTLTGMQFMVSSGDFLMLYLGLELATLPLTILAAFDRDLRRSAEAGIKLILSSAVSSATLLFGLSLMYGLYGTLHFPELTNMAGNNNLHVLALIFFIAGLAFKISLVPFHLWTADVYEGAPISVTSYFSVVSKGASLFTLMIVLFTLFGNQSETWGLALYALGISTMAIGNLFALRQKNLKRFMAFSSITQAGFMMLGFMDKGAMGMGTVIYFMLVYVFSNLGAFGVLSIVSRATGKEGMDDYKGFYSNNPYLSLVLLLALFSLAGIPPVAGFFGKFFLFTAAASKGMYILVIIAVINATISLYYYLLVVKAMFIEKNDQPIATLQTTGLEKISLWICFIGIVSLGLLSPVYAYILAMIQSNMY